MFLFYSYLDHIVLYFEFALILFEIYVFDFLDSVSFAMTTFTKWNQVVQNILMMAVYITIRVGVFLMINVMCFSCTRSADKARIYN